jgi:hypothetical protein
VRANLPDKNWFIGKPLPTRPDIVIAEFVGSGNDGHVFRGRSAELQRDFACKIIPRANLAGASEGNPRWRIEVEKADNLRSPVVVRFVDIKDWTDAEHNIDCVVLISDFVAGQSLRDFITQNRRGIAMSFILHCLETMLDLFNEMAGRPMMHGDFHAGNVLVEDRSYALVGPKYAFRVTDFGVASATSDARFKDDYLQLAVVVRQLLEEVDYANASPRDKFFFNALNNEFLARHLVEENPTLDPLARNPRGLFERLREIDREFDMTGGGPSTQLVTPFDFLSCEQIGDVPSVLRALYSELFLGLREIESRNNVVVTGPRGCGKSTVFKNLSLRQKLRVNEATPDKTTYVGIYYRCDDLYFAFPRYHLPEREEALDLPVHFITATLLSELLDSIERWATVHFQQEFRRGEARAALKLWEVLRLAPPKQPGIETFKAVATELQKQRKLAADKHRFAHDPKRPIGTCFGADVLQRTCAALTESFSFLRDRPFYFFIDDYSSPKVTKVLQENLNRVFMQRTPVCFFKLSTESPVSFSKSDVDKKIYVETREFILHNLGLVYLHADTQPKLEFIEDVFRRRLSAPAKGYPVKELTELLGANPAQNFNEDARQLRDGKKPELWGKETLCRLCSGDIHYLISLVRDMVVLAGGPDELAKAATTPRVAPRMQNKAIREAAGVFLKNLRSIPRHGDQLVAIVTAFGNVAHSFLKFRNSRNEAGNPPQQASRIEPYEPFTLSEPAQRLYDELLRYSVFIEDFRGKSRRGKVVPRLYLRRFLIPHFNLTFSTRDSIELEPHEFEQFLLDPATFEDKKRQRTPEPESYFATDKNCSENAGVNRQVDLPFNSTENGS